MYIEIENWQVLQKKMIEESVKPHAARILAQGKGTSEKELDKYREVRAQETRRENHAPYRTHASVCGWGE